MNIDRTVARPNDDGCVPAALPAAATMTRADELDYIQRAARRDAAQFKRWSQCLALAGLDASILQEAR